MNRIPLSKQIRGIETIYAIAIHGMKRPRSSEIDLLQEYIDAAVETLRWNERNADKIRRAFGNIEGDRL